MQERIAEISVDSEFALKEAKDDLEYYFRLAQHHGGQPIKFELWAEKGSLGLVGIFLPQRKESDPISR